MENKAPIYLNIAEVRAWTEALCEPLQYDDFLIQSSEFVSPPKWHLAHTSWFFETFLLLPYQRGYATFHPKFAQLFNSYYQTLGDFHRRPLRGVLSRPTLEEVRRYRKHVTDATLRLVEETSHPKHSEILKLVELGCQHEQQHQELLLMDIKHIFYSNPLRPIYRQGPLAPATGKKSSSPGWQEFEEGLFKAGNGSSGFCFDNETPSFSTWVPSVRLADRLVTNAEMLEFIEARGYERPEYWLSDGWDKVQAEHWKAPLYWECHERQWLMMTFEGMKEINEVEPVCHVSYYEADAFARWAGKRLPTEFEWERAAASLSTEGNFLERSLFAPQSVSDDKKGLRQMFGDVWEWTQSAYSAYPGYRPPTGTLAEYNGKFMCNQLVLRGGSFATPQRHIRSTYRNFYQPEMRWQFSGFRLAETK